MSYNRCIGLKIVHSVDLLSSVEVQSCLVWIDLVCCEVTLSLHRPYWGYNLDVFRDFVSFLEGPIVAIHMSVDFLDNRLHEFLCILLFERLLKVHDATYHFCMEHNGILHSFLKVKVHVMKEVFIGFFESGLVCHMVETLSNRSCHFSWHRANPPTLACTSCDSRLSTCSSLTCMRSPGLAGWSHILCDLRISIRDAVIVRSKLVEWWSNRDFLRRNVGFRLCLGIHKAVLHWRWHLGKNHFCMIQYR